MEIDHEDLFLINKIRNVKVSNEMNSIIESKFKVSID